MSTSTKLFGGITRAHHSYEQIIKEQDFFGFVAKDVLGGDKCTDRIVKNLAFGVFSEGYFAITGLKNWALGRKITAGPIQLNLLQEYHDIALVDDQDEAILLDGNYISAHYSGGPESIRELPKYIGMAASKLAAKHSVNTNLPERIVGISNFDMTKAIAHYAQLPLYSVIGTFDPYLRSDMLSCADASRAVRGKPPLTNRALYAVTMPTDEFIWRYTD